MMTQAREKEETSRGHTTLYHQLLYRNDELVTRTYAITPDLVARLDEAVCKFRVGHSDLVRYLLSVALDQVESGSLEIPVKTPGLLLIDHDK